MLEFIDELAEGEPDGTKLAYLARCSSRTFHKEVKAILAEDPDWQVMQRELKAAFGRSPDLIWKDMEDLQFLNYRNAAKFIMQFKKLAEEATQVTGHRDEKRLLATISKGLPPDLRKHLHTATLNQPRLSLDTYCALLKKYADSTTMDWREGKQPIQQAALAAVANRN